MKSLSDIFKGAPNTEILQAVSPYAYKFQNFTFTAKALDANPVPLAVSDLPVEFVLVAARSGNTGTVNLWNEAIGAAVGISLSAGDGAVLTEDNDVWNMAEALAKILGQENKLPRQAINARQWFLVGSAATQNVDICFGMGPAL